MSLSRRDAVKLVGAVAALPGSMWAKAPASSIHLGAQTNAWSIDAKNLDSLVDVLTQIKNTGYEGFETGYFNLVQHLDRISEVKKALASTGLRFFGLHIAVGADKCDPNTLLPLPSLYEPLAKAAKKLGAQHWIGEQYSGQNCGANSAEGWRVAQSGTVWGTDWSSLALSQSLVGVRERWRRDECVSRGHRRERTG